MTLQLRFAAATDTGRVRSNNEDRWAADPKAGLFLVADGLGGHQAGELASYVVAESLPPMLAARAADVVDVESLAQAVLDVIRRLSNDLHEQASDQAGLEGMGATLVVLVCRDDQAIVAHLGDCRGYLLRDGQLRRLTRDHTLLQLLLDRREISAAEAAQHPARSQVTRYVGMPTDPLPEICRLALLPHDRLLLCSDGLSGMVDEAAIERLAGEPQLETGCRRLVAAANDAGGSDNVTVVLVEAAP